MSPAIDWLKVDTLRVNGLSIHSYTRLFVGERCPWTWTLLRPVVSTAMTGLRQRLLRRCSFVRNIAGSLTMVWRWII